MRLCQIQIRTLPTILNRGIRRVVSFEDSNRAALTRTATTPSIKLVDTFCSAPGPKSSCFPSPMRGRMRQLVSSSGRCADRSAPGTVVLHAVSGWDQMRRYRVGCPHAPRGEVCATAVSGLSPVIITVRIPIARNRAKRSRMPSLIISFR